jgi:N-acetylglucosamine repressor
VLKAPWPAPKNTLVKPPTNPMPNPSLGNRDLIRAINRSIILNTIKTQGLVARAEVARLTGLSPATVTGITADLIDEGLVYEKAPGDSNGGRRPILLAINPNGAFVAGIKLMENAVVGALVNLEGAVVCKLSVPLAGRVVEDAIGVIAGLVETLVRCAEVPHTRLLGVGLGLAGIVDSERGVLRRSPYLGWRDLPLRDLLQARLEVPVSIDNDVNTLTLAEQWFGAGQGAEDFLAITVGRGVGLGIVTNRQFYRGVHGGAGEFGHTVVDPQGPLCDCGKHGCLETFVGDPGLLRMAHEMYAGQGAAVDGSGALNPEAAPRTTDELLALAEAGDECARAVFARAGEILGRSVANLINIFNPERVILSGEGVRYGKWLFGPMQVAVAQHALPGLREDAQISIEPWGDDAWARGAASLVLRQLFEHPAHQDAIQQAA